MAKYILLAILLITIPTMASGEEVCDLVCHDQHAEDMADFEQWYKKYLDNQYQIGVKDKLWTYDIQECMTDSECEEAWARAEELSETEDRAYIDIEIHEGRQAAEAWRQADGRHR